MLSSRGDLEACGGAVAFNAEVMGGRVRSGWLELEVSDCRDAIRSRVVAYAAGLNPIRLAARISGLDVVRIPTPCFAKGSYFSLSGKFPFSRLIYPLPEQGGLGVHVTLGLLGQTRFGSDVEWVEQPNFEISGNRRTSFVQAIRAHWPECSGDRLHPEFAGVRPKLETLAKLSDDFVIEGPGEHGVYGLVNLFGIESAELAAPLAIADGVASRLSIG